MIKFVSIIASFTSVISLIPQLYQTFKMKRAEELSIYMILNFIVCSVSWVIYGFLINSKSVMITNFFMTFSSVVMLIFKIRYRKKC